MDARGGKLFEAFNLQLEAQGYIAREGSIIDASFTAAPRQRNSLEQNQRIKEGGRPKEFNTNPAVGRQKDSEARWTKKNNEDHYAWKNHVKADLKTKLIMKATTTPAHVHDSQVFEDLLDNKDQAVLADSAYHNAEHEEHLIKLNAQEFLMRKATRGYALSQKEQQTNHTISRMRVRVEHVFARMGADGSRLVSEHRVETSHTAQPSDQPSLQHGPLCLPGPLRRAAHENEYSKRANESETPLKSPPKRKPTRHLTRKKAGKTRIFRSSEPLAKMYPLSRGALK
jgi:IS5 family transposase